MLSIVIITHNTKGLVENLLRSIEGDGMAKSGDAEVVVVDNGSSDGTAAAVRRHFPWVRCVETGTNGGFARAANIGAGACGGEYILFLNSDTLLVPGDLARLLAFMEGEPAACICGPLLVYPDLKPQRSFAPVPSLLPEIVPPPLLAMLMPRSYAVKRRITKPCPVPSLIGAAMVVRRTALEELSGFDERFFFFLEETDLCVRARRHGHGVFLFPGARVIHLQGKTVGARWVKGRIEYNISLNKFMEKHHGRLYGKIFRGLRFVKHFLSLCALSLFPFIEAREKRGKRVEYYREICRWYVRGCPDDAGLKANSPG